ncbi:MAG: DNA gyrase subunit A [Planctomycetes bacterium]|nr:DNA gyrase subunit A [Planctomycetota bacterium]
MDSPDRPPGEVVRERFLEEEMKDSYLNYAMSVIISRALPDARDGLKPSQRRILVAMNDLKLASRSRFVKCASIVGETMKKYHPHGDGAIYPTLVRMAQDFNMRYLLVDPQGNFGSIEGDPPAAMRYTEARTTEATEEMLTDLDKETVDLLPNFDDSLQEPAVLPSRLPNLLVNGSSGIAVGMATSIPPHNLTEIAQAVKRVVDDPEVEDAELLRLVRGPDFPTGGLICGQQGIREAYTTGRGRVTVRARIHAEETKTGKQRLVVTEIPYQVQLTALIDRVAETVKDGTIQGIADVVNESDREGMRLVIELKRGEEEQVVLNQLYKHTPLQETFSIIMIALVDQRPRLLTLKQLLLEYRRHRMEVIRRRARFLLGRALERAHVVEGLLFALDRIDEVIAIIRAAPDVDSARTGLMALRGPAALLARAEAEGPAEVSLSAAQADAILAMRLSRLTGLERQKLREELEALVVEIEGHRAILRDEARVLAIIRADMDELASRFGDARRTEIVADAADLSVEDLIAQEDMVVTVSHEGYVKRMPVSAHRAQGRGGKGLTGAAMREGDFVEHVFVASTHDTILLFTNLGYMHALKVYDLPLLARTAKGRGIRNFVQLQSGEEITSLRSVREFREDRFLVMATAGGYIKKTQLSAFANVARGGIIAINLGDGDRLIGVAVTDGEAELFLATREGQAVRFHEAQVRSMGRQARGVIGARLRGDDRVVDLTVLDPGATLLTICQHGYGKRTTFDEYRATRRGGLGVINIQANQRNGKVVRALVVRPGDGVMVMSSQGMLIRTPVDEISVMGRNTQGVRCIRLDENDTVSGASLVAREDDPGAEGGGAPEGGPSGADEADLPDTAGDDELA